MSCVYIIWYMYFSQINTQFIEVYIQSWTVCRFHIAINGFRLWHWITLINYIHDIHSPIKHQNILQFAEDHALVVILTIANSIKNKVRTKYCSQKHWIRKCCLLQLSCRVSVMCKPGMSLLGHVYLQSALKLCISPLGYTCLRGFIHKCLVYCR